MLAEFMQSAWPLAIMWFLIGVFVGKRHERGQWHAKMAEIKRKWREDLYVSARVRDTLDSADLVPESDSKRNAGKSPVGLPANRKRVRRGAGVARESNRHIHGG